MTEPLLIDNLRAARAALAFEAVTERATLAETYSRTAADFAAIRDRRGLSYALRQAAVAIASAADAASTLYPEHQGGGR